MRRIGIAALYRRPRTSIPAGGGSIYLHLLEKLTYNSRRLPRALA